MPQRRTKPNIQHTIEVVNDITDEYMIELSVIWAKLYQQNPKAFISSFKKYTSIKMASAHLVTTFNRKGIYQDCLSNGKDFTEWVEKQDIERRWKKLFADLLLIIYSITQPIDNLNTKQ
jgi:hypothetical protein